LEYAFDESKEDLEKFGLRIVVLSGFFSPEVGIPSEEDLDNLHEDILNELESIGEVLKFELFRENPQGIVKVKFKLSSHAATCKERMHGRMYDGNLISADFWDGETDYRKVEESEETQKQNIDEFGNWLGKGNA
jgi:HIV Tat-specific factor 1